MHKIKIIIPTFFILVGSLLNAQKIAVVDVQKTFDGYQKVKDARERLDRSKKIAVEELEIFKAEIVNSGKPSEMVEKISKGKITKFLNDNSLLNQVWIMDPQKKVIDVLKENSLEKEIKILDFVRFKVGEGID